MSSLLVRKPCVHSAHPYLIQKFCYVNDLLSEESGGDEWYFDVVRVLHEDVEWYVSEATEDGREHVIRRQFTAERTALTGHEYLQYQAMVLLRHWQDAKVGEVVAESAIPSYLGKEVSLPVAEWNPSCGMEWAETRRFHKRPSPMGFDVWVRVY